MTAATIEPTVDYQLEEAELGVVGGVLLAGALGEENGAHAVQEALAAGLEREHFYSFAAGKVFAAALELHEAGVPITTVTVSAHLRDARQFDDQVAAVLMEAPALTVASGNIRQHAAEVVAASRQRDLGRAALQLLDVAKNGWAVTPELAANVTAALEQAAGRGQDELPVEEWDAFAAAAGADVDYIIDGLLAKRALVAVASPPKFGKTWIALALAVSVATGRPLFGRFHVNEAAPVLYVALEGQRAGLRARISAIARGLDTDPDNDLAGWLTISYKPPAINLADPAWAARLRRTVERLGAQLVVIDVLRAAAQIKENDASDIAALVANLRPILGQATVVLIHHFAKLNETQKERAPGERMAGSGALYGAVDLGLFITASENHARKMRIHVEARDFAAPDPFGVSITGEGTGLHGGFTHLDSCQLELDEPPAERELKAPAAAIAEFVKARGNATPKEIRDHFTISEGTLRSRRDQLEKLGILYRGSGQLARYEHVPDEQLEVPS